MSVFYPPFWGREWLCQSYGHLAFFGSFCWNTPIPIKFLVSVFMARDKAVHPHHCRNNSSSHRCKWCLRPLFQQAEKPLKLLRCSSHTSHILQIQVRLRSFGRGRCRPFKTRNFGAPAILVPVWVFRKIECYLPVTSQPPI